MSSALQKTLLQALRRSCVSTTQRRLIRCFHTSKRLDVVKPFLLTDIGEGITECQLIQWFVQPGARVEQFDKLCEVQSDKASVEITSPFDGVIEKLHYEPDDMAITGKPLVDIDIQGEISAADEGKLGGEASAVEGEDGKDTAVDEQETDGRGARDEDRAELSANETQDQLQQHRSPDHGTLATPAVRHLTKELSVDLSQVAGTGKDGRVLKEDVHRHVSQRDQQHHTQPPAATNEDRTVPLSPVQSQMFKTMSRSLSIPHFLYSTSADMTATTALRNKINVCSKPEDKITHLAFIMKATSLSFLRHPLLNASLVTQDTKKPQLTYRGSHHFGLAIDTTAGLLVPVIRNVQDLSISDIALEMRRLSEAAKHNKLTPRDFSGATFTVSNIGSIGGGVVSPVITEPQVAILGIGRSKIVPAFDAEGSVIKKEELILSWSADHRVVDGAECARCAEQVKRFIEEPSTMMIQLR